MDEKEAAPPPAPPAPPRSIGERLRAGRERAGLSVGVAAEKLHLDPKVIEALEADRFAELGAAVYVRGHLRRYADFVGEAGAELVSRYTEREALPRPPDLTLAPKAEPRADARRLVTPLAGLACAAVLLLAIWWVVSDSRSESTRAATANTADPTATHETPPATNTAADAIVAPPETAVPASTQAGGSLTGATAGTGVAGSAQSQPKRDADLAATPVSVREASLKLNFTNDSWVEIYDARGERLFFDVASAGTVQNVRGPAPLRVVLGFAAGVAVEVDGRAREIPAAAMAGEGARFVVNRSGSLSRAR